MPLRGECLSEVIPIFVYTIQLHRDETLENVVGCAALPRGAVWGHQLLTVALHLKSPVPDLKNVFEKQLSAPR